MAGASPKSDSVEASWVLAFRTADIQAVRPAEEGDSVLQQPTAPVEAATSQERVEVLWKRLRCCGEACECLQNKIDHPNTTCGELDEASKVSLPADGNSGTRKFAWHKLGIGLLSNTAMAVCPAGLLSELQTRSIGGR